jgi:hypothetical protein
MSKIVSYCKDRVKIFNISKYNNKYYLHIFRNYESITMNSKVSSKSVFAGNDYIGRGAREIQELLPRRIKVPKRLMQQQDYVMLKYDGLKFKAAKDKNYVIGNKEYWLPSNHIREGTDPSGHFLVIQIPTWLATKKGLTIFAMK